MAGRRYYPMLDAMRGIAAIMIMLYHLCQHHEMAASRFGALAVDFFFLLSGFVIADNYDARLAGGMRWSGFMAKRLVRLYPLIFIGMAMGIAISAARVLIVHDVSWTQWLAMAAASLLVLPSYALPQYPAAFPANLPMWSMFFELVANLIYALGFRWLRGRGLAAVIVLSFGGLIALQLANGTIQAGMDKADLWGGLPRVGFSFFFGVAIARRGVAGGSAPGWIWPLAAGFASLLFVGDYAPGWGDLPIVAVVLPALLIGAAAIEATPVTGRIAAWLGALSFPLYVVHVPILRAGVTLQRMPRFAAVPEPMFMAIETVLILAVALLLAVTVDGFVRVRLKAWAARRRR